MVAFFTGLGAGLERGSAAALGSAGLIGGGLVGRGGDAVSVNARTGNLVISRQDEFLVGRGLDASMGRTYNSQGAIEESGDHWRIHDDRRILGLVGGVNSVGSTIRRISADGSDVTYTYSARAGRWSYWTTDGGGAHDELQFNGNQWTWIEGGSNKRETYNDFGGGTWRMHQQIDIDGSTLTYAYHADGRLYQTTTSDGGWIRYDWAGNNLSQIVTGFFNTQTGQNQQRTSTQYSYDTLARLQHVHVNLTRSDGQGGGTYVTTYHYYGSSRQIAAIGQTDGSWNSFGYDGAGRINWIHNHAGDGSYRETRLEYHGDSTHIIDPRGNRTVLNHNGAGQLTALLAPEPVNGASRPTTTFQYDGDGNLISTTNATGGVTTFAYDARGNTTSTTDATGRGTVYDYDSANRLVAERSWGTRSNGPTEQLTKRLVYNSAGRLEFEVTSEGRVTQYGYYSNGLLNWKRGFSGYQYMPGSTHVPTATDLYNWIATAGISYDRTTFEEFRYDARGDVSEIVRWGMPLAIAGWWNNTEGYSHSFFIRDHSGRVIQEWTAPENSSHYVYDGLGRVVVKIDPISGQTTIAFNDATTTTTVTNMAGGTTISVYNKLGQLISETDGGWHVHGGTDTFLYDHAGNLRRSIDSTGRSMYHVWDRAGRKVADVGGEGSMVEYRYDAAGRVVATARYTHWAAGQLGTLNDLNAELEISQMRPPAHPYDIWEWKVYDQAGRVVQTIMGDGSTTRYEYDNAGRLIKTFGYGNPVPASTIQSYMAGGLPVAYTPSWHALDTLTRSFYDGDGLLIGSLAPDGGLTRIEYDGKGRKIAEHRYVNFAADDNWTRVHGTLDQIFNTVPKDASLDVTLRWVYDGQDQLRYEIDGAGRVTEYRYWDNIQWFSIGKPRRIIQHAVALPSSVSDFSYASVQSIMAQHVENSNNRINWNIYNEKGQLVYTVDAESQVTHFKHDAGGRVIRTARFAEPINMSTMGQDYQWMGMVGVWVDARMGSARVERNYYNARGDLRATVDAENFVTVFHHDSEGRVTHQQRFANKVPVEDWWSFHEIWNTNKGAAVDRYFGYDGLGRAVETYDENGNRTWQGYWHTGLKSWEISAAWQDGESRVHYIYDQAGRLKHELVTNNELETYGWYGNSSTTKLNSNHRLISPNWAYQMGLSAQGELQIYHHGNLIWSNGVRDSVIGATYTLDAQNDGNLVIYRHQAGQGPTPIWYTSTAGSANGPTFIAIQDDGNFVLYRGTPSNNQGVIWTSATNGRTGSGPGSWIWKKNYSYNGLGQVISIHDADSVYTRYEYDRAGRVSRVTDGNGGVTEYHYDAAGQQRRTRDARGHDSYTYYDRTGRVIANLDAEGYLSRTEYNGFGEVASVKRFMNRANGVGGNGQQPSVSDHGLDATTQYQYDKLGRVTVMTDAEGHQELYQYNSFGQRSAMRNKLGGWTYYQYDKRGLLTQEQLNIDTFDSAGNRKSWHIHNNFEYDSRGNMTRKAEAAGFAEERNTWFEYDAGNRLIAKKSDARLVVANGTDNGSVIQPVETYQYDRRGNVTQITAADGKRTLRWYNLSNQVTHEISNGGTLTRYFYGADGTLSETRVYGDRVGVLANARVMPPAGGNNFRSVRYVYDNLNRVIETRTGPVHTAQMNGDTLSVQWRELVVSYQYDAMGNVTRTTDADGHHVHAWYDKLGRKTAEVDQGAFRTDWTHDANGNVLSERRQAVSTWNVHHTLDDRVTSFGYDKMGRRMWLHRHNVLVHDFHGNQAMGSSTIYYYYNGLGQVTYKYEATGDWSYNTYDHFGRLTQQHKGAVNTLDGSGNIGLTYLYDGLGNLVRTHKWGWGGTAGRTTTYTYSKGGLLEVSTDSTGNQRKFVHDAAGRVTRQEYWRHQHWVGGVYEAIATDYDADGRVSATGMAKWNGSSWSRRIAEGDLDTSMMTYNAYGDVEQRGINNVYTEKFAYDNAGRLFRSNAGDGVERYFVYDGRGNQTLMIASEGMDIRGQSLDWVMDRWGGDRNAMRHNFVDGVTATITRFDGRGLAVEVIEPQREMNANYRLHVHTHRGYTAFGEVAWEQDARGNRIDYTYNTMGRQIKVESPHVTVAHENGSESWARPTEHRYYDASGRLVGQRDANGNLTRYTLMGGTGYDGKEALITNTLYADGNSETRTYDMHGDLRVVNDRGRITNMYYDQMGRLTATEQAGMWQWQAYDSIGQVYERWSSIQPWEARSFIGYDAQGRIVLQNAAGGDHTWTSYQFISNFVTHGMGHMGGWTKTTTYANGRTNQESTDLFGRTTYTIDMGGNHSATHFDLAGRMTMRNGGTPMYFTWLNTGKMRSQYVDFTSWSYEGAHTTRRETWYHYDASGNVTHQGTYRTGQEAIANDYGYGTWYTINNVNETHENQSAQYDALGRITLWQEHGGHVAGAHTYYRYDAAGNVRRTWGANWSLNNAGSPTVQVYHDHWYRYDSMNRVVTDKGQLENGQIVRGHSGTDIFYNAQGDRSTTLRAYTGSQWIVDWNYYDPNWVDPNAYNGYENYYYTEPGGYPGGYYVSFTAAFREDYAYDAGGRLTEVRQVSGNYGSPTPTGPGGVVALIYYDVAGRQTRQIDYTAPDSWTMAYDQTTSYDAAGRVSSTYSETRQGNDIVRATTNYDYGGTWQGGAYALGQVMSVTSNSHKNWSNHSNSTTTYNYAWYQGAVQQSINHTQTGSPAGNTWFSYNHVAGQAVMTQASISDGRSRTVNYATNLMGEVVKRWESASGTGGGAPAEYWYRYAGKEMGKVGNDGTLYNSYISSITQRQTQAGQGAFENGRQWGNPEADFGSRLEGISSYNQGSAAGTITARGGETLQAVAASLWGDSGLWYKLAQANGLSGDAALSAGQTLRVPAGVIRNTYNAATITPTDPADTLGDVNPTSPQAAPPKKQRCGVVGQILLVVIAVVVAWHMAPHLIAAVANMTAAAGATAVTAAAVAGGATVSATATVIGGGLAAAAGSIVSQAVGVATGIQEKFSWKGVALAFISGGVGGGVSKVMGAAQSMAGAALRGAASSAISQGIGVALGLQDKFSWAAVAAAGVGAGVSGAVSGAMGSSGINTQAISSRLAIGMADAMAQAATLSLIQGTDFGDNIRASLPSVLGNAISGYLAEGGGKGPSLLDVALSPLTYSPANVANSAGLKILADNPNLTPEERARLDEVMKEWSNNTAEARSLAWKGDTAGATAIQRRMMDQAMSFYPQDQQEAARALLAKPVVDTAASDAATGSIDGSVEIIEVYGERKYGRAFGLFDRPGVLAGRLKGRVEGEVGAWVDRTPGARAALTTVEFGMAIAGGPVRFFAGLGLGAAHEKVVQKTTERFEAVGYSSEIARSGGEGLPWLAGIALGSVKLGALGAHGRIQGLLALYPEVIDMRTGRPIMLPADIGPIVPKANRVAWGSVQRRDFISEWYKRGYADPEGGWSNYDIHHIKPREYGGTNDFWNLTPVARKTHKELNSFWKRFPGL